MTARAAPSAPAAAAAAAVDAAAAAAATMHVDDDAAAGLFAQPHERRDEATNDTTPFPAVASARQLLQAAFGGASHQWWPFWRSIRHRGATDVMADGAEMEGDLVLHRGAWMISREIGDRYFDRN